MFAVGTNGTGFLVLHAFTASSGFRRTNVDGGDPLVGLVLAGNTLFGVGGDGGTNGYGTVFSVSTNATDFRVLYTFSAPSGSSFTNSDGAYPSGDMVASGNTLYGVAGGGTNGAGVLFSLTIPASSLPPWIAGLNPADPNLVINAANLPATGTCVVLMSTDLTVPLSQWTPVATNTLNASGTLTITATNQFVLSSQVRFYILSVR